MSIWSADNHIRHPWFDYRIKKRKRSLHERAFSTSSDESEAGEGRSVKRARCSALEDGLAHLSLFPTVGDEIERGPMVVEIPRGEENMDSMDERAVFPSSVEEPEQDIPEVEMKTSSWYEIDPHRIVITDLDSFEAEDDNGNESCGLTVNADLLKYLKDRPRLLPREFLNSSADSQALVLFRPLPIPDGILDASEQTVRDVESMEVEFSD